MSMATIHIDFIRLIDSETMEPEPDLTVQLLPDGGSAPGDLISLTPDSLLAWQYNFPSQVTNGVYDLYIGGSAYAPGGTQVQIRVIRDGIIEDSDTTLGINETAIFAKNYITADGVTDDSAGLASAYNAAKTQGKKLILPSGTIRIASTWTIANSSQDKGVIISGQGPYNTTIKPDSGINAIQIGNGGSPRTRNVILENLFIRGNAGKTNYGIYLNSVGNVQLRNVRIGESGAGFDHAVYCFRTEHTVFHNLDALYNANGVYFTTNANGNVFIGGGVGQVDGYCYYFDLGSNGNAIIGGEAGNATDGVIVDQASDVVIQGMNIESCTGKVLHIKDLSKMSVFMLKYSDGGSGGAWLAYLEGAGKLYFSALGAVDMVRTEVIHCPGTARVVALDFLSPHIATDEAATPHVFKARNYLVLPENSGVNLNSADYRNDLVAKSIRSGIAGADTLYWGQETDAGNWALPISDNSDFRIIENGATGVRKSKLRTYAGWKVFTTDAAALTDVTITTDPNGFLDNRVYGASGIIYKSGGGSIFAHVQLKSWNSANGQITFTVHHPNDTGGSIGLQLYFKATVRPTTYP